MNLDEGTVKENIEVLSGTLGGYIILFEKVIAAAKERGKEKAIDWVIETLPFLQELRQRRSSALIPAVKYLTNTVDQQFGHLEGEIREVRKEVALCKTNKSTTVDRIAEELVDVQMSAETMLEILGFCEEERMELRKSVIKKNKDRGYDKK